MLKVHAHKNFTTLNLDVLVMEIGVAAPAVAQPVELIFASAEPNSRHEPTIKLDLEIAEQLFQAMWDQGFRPVQGSSGKAEVDAQARHIAFAEGVAHALLAHIQK